MRSPILKKAQKRASFLDILLPWRWFRKPKKIRESQYFINGQRIIIKEPFTPPDKK